MTKDPKQVTKKTWEILKLVMLTSNFVSRQTDYLYFFTFEKLNYGSYHKYGHKITYVLFFTSVACMQVLSSFSVETILLFACVLHEHKTFYSVVPKKLSHMSAE